jgi:hypothetical protein
MMGVPSAATNGPAALEPDRSPWAPPSTVPPVTNAAPPEMPAPAVTKPAESPIAAAAPKAATPVETAAPTPAITQAPTVGPTPAAPVMPKAPVVAPPKVTNAPVKGDGKDAKGKFRETMWFKKGDLDAQAAVAAAEERARTGKDSSGDKADSLPMDERYKDDGSISRGDKEKYSLRTGGTQMMAAMKDKDAASSMGRVSEMKSGRSKIIMIVVGALLVVGLLVAYFATR